MTINNYIEEFMYQSGVDDIKASCLSGDDVFCVHPNVRKPSAAKNKKKKLIELRSPRGMSFFRVLAFSRLMDIDRSKRTHVNFNKKLKKQIVRSLEKSEFGFEL